MAKLTFNIPDSEVNRLMDAWSEHYQTEVLDQDGSMIPNPQTKQQYARQQMRQMLSDRVRHYEAQTASGLDITDG